MLVGSEVFAATFGKHLVNESAFGFAVAFLHHLCSVSFAVSLVFLGNRVVELSFARSTFNHRHKLHLQHLRVFERVAAESLLECFDELFLVEVNLLLLLELHLHLSQLHTELHTLQFAHFGSIDVSNHFHALNECSLVELCRVWTVFHLAGDAVAIHFAHEVADRVAQGFVFACVTIAANQQECCCCH